MPIDRVTIEQRLLAAWDAEDVDAMLAVGAELAALERKLNDLRTAAEHYFEGSTADQKENDVFSAAIEASRCCGEWNQLERCMSVGCRNWVLVDGARLCCQCSLAKTQRSAARKGRELAVKLRKASR